MADLPGTLSLQRLSKFAASLVPAFSSAPPVPPVSIETFRIKINANPKHPTIVLFLKRRDAADQADVMGAPWVPVSYACGYVLTDGWNFRDVNGPLATFCPVTLPQLDVIRPLVAQLKREQVPGRELPARIATALRPLEENIAAPAFEAACLCTLLRIGYAMPNGAEEDWLTNPAWALRIPARRGRLQ